MRCTQECTDVLVTVVISELFQCNIPDIPMNFREGISQNCRASSDSKSVKFLRKSVLDCHLSTLKT